MIKGRKCKVSKKGNEDWYGVIASEPAMKVVNEEENDWFVLVLTDNKFVSVDVYYIEIED